MTLLNYLDIRRLKTVLYETGETAWAGMSKPFARQEIENCVQNAGHESEIAVYTCRKNLKMVPS